MQEGQRNLHCLLNQTKHIIYYADMCVRDGSKRTMRQAPQALYEDTVL